MQTGNHVVKPKTWRLFHDFGNENHEVRLEEEAEKITKRWRRTTLERSYRKQLTEYFMWGVYEGGAIGLVLFFGIVYAHNKIKWKALRFFTYLLVPT